MKKMKKTGSFIALVLAMLVITSGCSDNPKSDTAVSRDGLHASIQHESDSPEWVTQLPSAQDEAVTQLFVVAGMDMEKTTASISMHQRDKDGNWKQILSTPGYVGLNGLCPDKDHKEGCAETPIEIPFPYINVVQKSTGNKENRLISVPYRKDCGVPGYEKVYACFCAASPEKAEDYPSPEECRRFLEMYYDKSKALNGQG